MRFFILLILFFVSCSNKKSEYQFIFISNIPEKIWNDKNYNEFCNNEKDKVKIAYSLISQANIIENKYNRGKETIFFSEECFLDVLTITQNDLLYIEPKELSKYSNDFPQIIATNIYSKYDKKIKFNKYKILNHKGKKLLILSIISRDTDKPYYISDYRIEDAAYEINKINSSVVYNSSLIIFDLEKEFNNIKETKEYFTKLLSKITVKPDFILAPVSDNIKIGKTLIIALNRDIDIKIIKKFGFFIKPVVTKYFPNYSQLKPAKLEKIINNTKTYFNKTISQAINDIKIKGSDYSPLGTLYAYAISRFLKSDLVIFDNSLLNQSLKQGNITLKDIYLTLNDFSETLVYIKIRGNELEQLIDHIKKSDVSIYGKNEYMPNKIYRIITTKKLIKRQNELLNYITEFSVLKINLIDAIIWYARNHKLDIINLDTNKL